MSMLTAQSAALDLGKDKANTSPFDSWYSEPDVWWGDGGIDDYIGLCPKPYEYVPPDPKEDQ